MSNDTCWGCQRKFEKNQKVTIIKHENASLAYCTWCVQYWNSKTGEKKTPDDVKIQLIETIKNHGAESPEVRHIVNVVCHLGAESKFKSLNVTHIIDSYFCVNDKEVKNVEDRCLVYLELPEQIRGASYNSFGISPSSWSWDVIKKQGEITHVRATVSTWCPEVRMHGKTCALLSWSNSAGLIENRLYSPIAGFYNW